jgi:hypothetical protein
MTCCAANRQDTDVPAWIADGISVAEFITIVGALGTFVVVVRALRRMVIIIDALVTLIGALEHEFTPNGGRHVISSDDDSATTKDILLDIRTALKPLAAGQAAHEKHAEARADRTIQAIERVGDEIIRARVSTSR